MTINIISKGIKLNDELRTLIETSIGQIENRFRGTPTCKVTLKPVENNMVKVSVLIYSGKYVFKGERINKDRNIAFKRAIKDIERNLNKAKTRELMKRYMPNNVLAPVIEDEVPPEELTDVKDFIVTEKTLKVEPMTVEEAYLQMDILGHTFFVFVNSETGLINILYRKRNGDGYGLIAITR